MTTLALAAVHQGGSFFAKLSASIWENVVAFFEEAHAANMRTGREEPFGL